MKYLAGLGAVPAKGYLAIPVEGKSWLEICRDPASSHETVRHVS